MPSFAPKNHLGLLPMLCLVSACSSPGKEGKAESPKKDAALEAPANPASFPDIVARVNGKEIHKAELLERVANIEAQSQGTVNTSSIGFHRRVLDEIVGRELLYQASAEKNLQATTDEVDRQVSAFQSQFGDAAQFQQRLAAEGMTLDAVRNQVQRNLSVQKLVEKEIAPRVTVTDNEKRRYYDQNTEQMRMPDRLRLSHILKLVAADATPETKVTARKAINEIREQAVAGADFATLARKNSEDRGSAGNGGEMVITRGQTVPPFEEAAFALEPGGLSPVVETQFGFHIIKLSERVKGEVVPYEQAQGRIEQYLRQQGVQKEIDGTVDTLRKKAKLEIFL